MKAPVITFFNNKGGVGKTSLVFHLAWMYSELGLRVLVADLDPQANLTAQFLDEDRLEEVVFEEGDEPNTIYECVEPLLRGIGDVAEPRLESPAQDIGSGIKILAGDLSLSSFEDELASSWPDCADGRERGFRVESAFWRIIEQAALSHQADVVLMDLGPNLGAINRSALIATDYVVVPLTPDLFSLKGMRNLGPTLRRWRKHWKDRLDKNPADDLSLPQGLMEPAGYTVQQHSVRLDRPVKAYQYWIAQIPHGYHTDVLDEPNGSDLSVQEDPSCLALLKHYRSLMPMAQNARKPIFHLKAADGALGSHSTAARKAYGDFEELARNIAGPAKLALDPAFA